MSPNSMALVSPRDRRTSEFDQIGSATRADQPAVLLDGRSVAFGDYLARFPATEFMSYDRNGDLSSALSEASERSCTLDFCMMLFDSDLSPSVKQRAAEELDVLLLSDRNRTYALDILLSFPLPKDTDFEAAKAPTNKDGESYRVVCLLEETRERAEFAYTAWLSVRKHSMVAQDSEQRVRGKLILSGACRRAVTELKTKSLVHDHIGALMLDTQTHLDARVLQVFLNEYKTKLPEGMHTARSTDDLHSEAHSKPEYCGTQLLESIRARLGQGNAEAEQERAVREVEKIAELFLENKDQNARKYRDELVARQSTVNDHSHLVKSLCNIASKCTIGGRYDVAAECLTDAVAYKRGVDSHLFVQMGNLFKDLKKYDESADCLRKAEPLAKDSSERDLINRELARLLVAKGKYVEALEAFHRLSDIDSAPESRTSLATLLRKMGDLSTARSILEDVWLKHRTPQSYAGLAERHRQTGRLDKAIKKYKWLLAEQDLDERSAKVFRISLSSLYRAIGKLDAARLILDQLCMEYGSDVSIQWEMVKVFRLLGESERADELYHKSFARLHETDQMAAQLYETALMTRGKAPSVLEAADTILPEFQTLSHCNVVLRNIVKGDLCALRNIPAQASPFKLHADFDAVLSYHSQILLGVDVDPKGDVSVNRIRKRGLEDMKMAVRAIDQRNYDSALYFEQRTCLGVA